MDTWSEGKQVYVERSPTFDQKDMLDQDLKVELDEEEKSVPSCRDEKSVFVHGEVITTRPLPHGLFKYGSLPKNFDWRNLFGFNYVSWSTNQNVPNY